MSTTESEDYAADIWLMTSLLEGQKRGTCSSHQRRYEEDKPFVHLATLLSNSSSPIIAATGSIKPSGVETIIVLSGSSSTVQHPAPFVLRPIVGLDRAPEDTAQRLQPVTAGEVLKAEIKLRSAPIPIHQHVRDLFEVFKYVHNGDVSKVDMKKWVLSRGYRKLSSRLNKIHASWGKLDLITRLRSWRPQANEVITGFVDVSAPQHAGVAQVVRTWVVIDDEKHILLSGDGASRFVGGCIASILERLREIVPKSIGEDRKLAFASEALSVLQILLDQERTKWLFTQTSLGEHLRPDRTLRDMSDTTHLSHPSFNSLNMMMLERKVTKAEIKTKAKMTTKTKTKIQSKLPAMTERILLTGICCH
ncbi:hypothetical protein L227DRAFT_567870 [Lentinus tigrinus ALCF2SS1-6]|uniref:Uncharacterized protein n=1 Tax=Lentinus tigrinus ALCF2SS1-6 TaxID=1328759 RepID=A0A5C2RRR9_9APHY|nr:hypothetical protein L227DRAFT_567870 [Lentinus tigrinus ALCF2SS1-6]